MGAAVAAGNHAEGCSCSGPAQLSVNAAVLWCLSVQGVGTPWPTRNVPPEQQPSTGGHCHLISVTVGTGSQAFCHVLRAGEEGALVNPAKYWSTTLRTRDSGLATCATCCICSPALQQSPTQAGAFVLQTSLCFIKSLFRYWKALLLKGQGLISMRFLAINNQ